MVKMKYGIEERNGIFTPQVKFLWWWTDFGYSYKTKELALQQIREHHKYHKELEPEPVYHYIDQQELN
jgi:hypothetical protein